MKLNIEDSKLHIKLNPLEIMLSHRGSLRVPLDHITQTSTKRPEWEWKQVRAPGTHIPFLLKAGTYHRGRGKEFWQATLGRPFLTIELRDWDYNRIVLTLGDNEAWAERINQAVQSMAEGHSNLTSGIPFGGRSTWPTQPKHSIGNLGLSCLNLSSDDLRFSHPHLS